MENAGADHLRATRILLLAGRAASAADRSSARRGDRPRARAHVVRRPRDDALVGRPLAQRGVRRLDGQPRRRPGLPGLGIAADELGGVQSDPRRRRAAERARRSASPSRAPATRWATSASPTTRARRCSTWWSAGSAPRRFQRGVRRYLAAHARGNATGEDLWGALGRKWARRGRDVAAVMRGFLDQPGYPLVSVEVRRREDRQAGAVADALPRRRRRSAGAALAGAGGAGLVRRRGEHTREVLLDRERLTVDLGGAGRLGLPQRRRRRLLPLAAAGAGTRRAGGGGAAAARGPGAHRAARQRRGPARRRRPRRRRLPAHRRRRARRPRSCRGRRRARRPRQGGARLRHARAARALRGLRAADGGPGARPRRQPAAAGRARGGRAAAPAAAHLDGDHRPRRGAARLCHRAGRRLPRRRQGGARRRRRRPCCGSPRSTATRRASRPTAVASRRRRTRRNDCTSCARWATSSAPSWWSAPSPTPSADRCATATSRSFPPPSAAGPTAATASSPGCASTGRRWSSARRPSWCRSTPRSPAAARPSASPRRASSSPRPSARRRSCRCGSAARPTG